MVESETKDEVATIERELNNSTVTFNVGSKQFRFESLL